MRDMMQNSRRFSLLEMDLSEGSGTAPKIEPRPAEGGADHA